MTEQKLKELQNEEMKKIKSKIEKESEFLNELAREQRKAANVPLDLDMTVRYNVIKGKAYKRSFKINDPDVSMNQLIDMLMDSGYCTSRYVAKMIIYEILSYKICVIGQ